PEPRDQPAARSAEKAMAFPRGMPLAAVGRHAGGRDRRHPVAERLRHARRVRALADLRADAVIDAVGDDRPAVIDAGTDHVHLVAALWPVLVGPEQSRLRMQRRALHVAVPEVEFLRLPPRLADEGVVLRDAAIVAQPDHRASVVIRSLRALHLPALAEREIQIAGAVEDDAAAEVDAARAFRALPEQHLHFLQLPAVQLCARELGPDAAFSAGGVRK